MKLIIDNKEVFAKEGQTILQAARDAKIYIPTLCYLSKCEPIGACRLCVVEVEGQNGDIAACQARAQEGMVVSIKNERLQKYRENIMKFYCVNHPLECGVCDKSGECELQNKTLEFSIDSQTFSAKEQKRDVQDWGLIGYDPSLCVLCEKCVHVCNEIIGDEAIKIKTGGYKSIIVPTKSQALDCTFCGECVAVCPVGALSASAFKYKANAWELKRISSACGHCASTCELFYEVKVNAKEQKIYRVTNDYENVTLCGAGRFAFDYENNTTKDKNSLKQAVDALKSAQYVRFNGFITNEEAYALMALKKELGVKLINPWANAYKKFIQNYALASGNSVYSATTQDIKECDGAIVFGTKVSTDNPQVRYALNNVSKKLGSKIVYMHPIEDELLANITDCFVKYEPSSEHAVAALLALNLCNKELLNTSEREYLDSLDDGFLSGEASFDEKEQEKIKKLMVTKQNKVLIVGADLYMHQDSALIAKLLGLLEKAAGFKTLMLPPETNSLGVAMICELDDDASGYGIGYNEAGDFVLTSLDGTITQKSLAMPALNQQNGTVINIDKKSIELNAALPYAGYTLFDLLSELCLKVEQHEPSICMPNDACKLEEIDSVNEMNGALAYMCEEVLHFSAYTHKSSNLLKTKDIIFGAKSFAQAAKVADGKSYTAVMDGIEYKVKFSLKPNMKGTSATISPKIPGYRFIPVVMRED